MAKKKQTNGRIVNELEQVHSLLDELEVPRVVSVGASYDRDRAYDRLIWLVHQSIGRSSAEFFMRKAEDGKTARDHLRKLADVYEAEHSSDQSRLTHPWMAVRWAKENRK